MPDEDPITQELRLDQIERERAEQARARESADEPEQQAHARRAERAAYLREKLEQRAEAERRG